MTSYIYFIINKVNNNIYIGSTNNFKKRIKEHFRSLQNNKHHSNKLQNAYNKYGKDSFYYKVHNVDHYKKLQIETILISLFKPEYNISINARAPMEGRKHSIDTLNKFKTRKVASGISHYLYGTKLSETTRMKMVKSRTGKKRNLETRLKMSETAKRLKSIDRVNRELSYKKISDNMNNVFKSLTDAARYWNISPATVCDILKGRHNKTKLGIIFKYEN